MAVRMLSVLSLFVVMITIPFGRSQSSCSAEVSACFEDDVCSSCTTLIQGLIEAGSIDTQVTECGEFYVVLCSLVDTDECDVTNEMLISLAGCILEEEYGCSDFTSCEDVTGMVGTASPTATPTAAPSNLIFSDDDSDSGASPGVVASAMASVLGILVALFVV